MTNSRIALYLTVLFFILFISCSPRYYDANKLLNDYKTEGFLDRDHFQVIISGAPDKGIKGLVAQRRSAAKNAALVMENKITENLAAYNINYNISRLNITDIKDILNLPDAKQSTVQKMREFMQYGYNEREYYNPDNSVVIVYRIFKEDLAEKIETVNPGFILEEKEKKSK